MRKWLLILLLAIPLIHAGLLRSPEPVDASGDVVLATGIATSQNQLRVSWASGGAFVDSNGTNAPDFSLFLGENIEICTTTLKRCVRGNIKALGTGETLSADVYSGWNFTSGWTPSGATINDSDTFTLTAASGYVYKANSHVAGALYKTKFSGAVSAGILTLYTGMGSGNRLAYPDGVFAYRDSGTANPLVGNSTGGVGAVTDITSLESYRVLTPSEHGATIVKSYGSDTYDWGVKTPGFNTSVTDNLVWRIIKSRPVGTLTTSGAVSSSDVRLATVDAGAMVEISGTDLSMYAGGDDNASLPCRWINPHSTTAATWKTNRYLLALYDSAGKVATGWIGGPGAGIALGSDILSGWDFTSGWSGDACTATVSDTNTFAISAASGCVYKTYSALDTGTLYYATLVGTPSAGTLSLRGNSSEPIWCAGNTCSGYGTATTNTNDKVLVYNSAGGVGATADITSMTLQPVTDIGITGVHLHSNPNAYDRKMARVDSGFDPNAVASYKIFQVGNSGYDLDVILQEDMQPIYGNEGASVYLQQEG